VPSILVSQQLDIEGAEAEVFQPGSGFEAWLCRTRFFYMEVHPKNHDRRRNRTNAALHQSATALLSCNMSIFTFPTLRNPLLTYLREYVYFACGPSVPRLECAATCAWWRHGSPHSCREVTGIWNYRGDASRYASGKD